VVEDSTKIEVKTVAGRKPATVLRIDKDKDLALLQVSVVKGSVPALIVSTNNAPLGAQVFTIGYPLIELQGSQPKFTDGKISSVAGLRDDPDEMQISVAVQPGNSGGPLADINGDIVGVVVARLNDMTTLALAGSIPQNVNYAVKGNTLVRFLRENRALAPGVKFGSSPHRTQEEAIQAVEKASGLVLLFE
jgi:S1-C subfamily serine protease